MLGFGHLVCFQEPFAQVPQRVRSLPHVCDPRGGQQLRQVLAEPDGDDLDVARPRAHAELQGEGGAHPGDVDRVAVKQYGGHLGEVEQQEVSRLGAADRDQPRIGRRHLAGTLLVQEDCVGGQDPPAALPGHEGRLRLPGEVLGQHLQRAGAEPRGPQRREFCSVALYGQLVGQGPQGHVQAGCAAGFGGRRQLGLGRGGLRGDGDLLAGPAAVALQRPAQGESARDGGGQQRARAENGTQAQRTAGRSRRRRLGRRGSRGGSTRAGGLSRG